MSALGHELAEDGAQRALGHAGEAWVGVPVCETCKQRIRKLNPHRMDRQKVRMLSLIGELGLDEKDHWVEVKAGRFPGFNGDDQVFAMRLQWFYLVEHGPKRSGLYRITDNGILFLKGKLSVPKTIWCRDGRVVDWDDEMVLIHQVKGVHLDKTYWNSYPSIQRDET